MMMRMMLIQLLPDDDASKDGRTAMTWTSHPSTDTGRYSSPLQVRWISLKGTRVPERTFSELVVGGARGRIRDFFASVVVEERDDDDAVFLHQLLLVVVGFLMTMMYELNSCSCC